MIPTVAIGVDLGGTNTAMGLVSDKGEILWRDKFSTKDYATAKEWVAAVASRVPTDMLIGLTLKGIGIGAPNGNIYKGSIDHAPNLKWKGEISLVDLFSKHFDESIAVTNDANAAAVGEMQFGAHKDLRNFICVTIGTGLGSGIVVQGKVLYGATGAAGELGHTTIVRDGRPCNCGKKGCLETYVSAKGLVRTFGELLQADSKLSSELKNLGPESLTPEIISRAAQEGDKIARKALRVTGTYLGEALADAVALLSCDKIILSGGIAKAGEYLFVPALVAMEENLYPVFKGTVEILGPGIPDEDAAILGAAAMVWQEGLDAFEIVK